MKKALLVGLLLFPLAASQANAKLHPSLGLFQLTPPTFLGSGFQAHERVTVSLGILPAATVRVSANTRGRFRVRLAAVPACGTWKVLAVGTRGSRAVYRHPACPSARSGVEGIVLRGPIVPVCVPGGPCDVPARDVTVQALQDENVVATTTTDQNGRFTLSLPPGYYTTRALGRGTEPRQVHVRPSQLVDVAFFIDTGIR